MSINPWYTRLSIFIVISDRDQIIGIILEVITGGSFFFSSVSKMYMGPSWFKY